MIERIDPFPCLRLDRVSKEFGGLKAVDHVSLTVQPGERRVLIGPNGAGKTTLFNLISGELPATEGRMTFCGEEVTRLAPHQRAVRGIARTFQITRLFPNLSVRENVLLACGALDPRKFALFRRLSSCSSLVENATRLISEFRLDDLQDECARHLSHGDQRRLDVALALAGRPRLLLLDEPMAGLSPAESESMRTLLGQLDPSMTILLIEHDMDVAFGFAERVTVLHQGKVLAEGDRDAVRANPSVQAIYLGTDTE